MIRIPYLYDSCRRGLDCDCAVPLLIPIMRFNHRIELGSDQCEQIPPHEDASVGQARGRRMQRASERVERRADVERAGDGPVARAVRRKLAFITGKQGDFGASVIERPAQCTVCADTVPAESIGPTRSGFDDMDDDVGAGGSTIACDPPIQSNLSRSWSGEPCLSVVFVDSPQPQRNAKCRSVAVYGARIRCVVEVRVTDGSGHGLYAQVKG